ncbi:response regulator transcription factor [Dyadobacter psychrophilus]|uniref:DNA-binding response regulator, OmpR family, contains REC and winged-helix (WHTH) domain n=1 Tax=Dyadobacter psychrophilus TaxID=651661 RepID=A0A1T5CPF4_9BACT|nr:response regulator transcription factor [Dyadobacter psychrophilus]SKB61304.1 DNA-binding response regulator, OmpR family, contains REC and winged-helix (wHTH) domain [Dyadobacter psychrophilus]
MKILIIEDEKELSDVIRQSLEMEAFLVETAGDYRSALDKIISFDYDCILLDIMLPGGSGLSLLQELKSTGKSDNVIIISAKDSLDDKLAGLNLGADDYLTKPFHIAELTARVKSVLRRKSFQGKHLIEIANLTLDHEERTVVVDGNLLALNRKEFDILMYMILNKNRLVNKTSLAEHVWGDYMDDSDDYEFIYSQIKNLRKKLKENRAGIEIQAVYGIGYKLAQL